MAKNFNALLDKMTPKARTRAEAKANVMLEELELEKLRQAAQLTQEHVAEEMGVNQAAVSKLEKRTDVLLSTLGNFVRALGGRMEILIQFPNATFRFQNISGLTAPRAKKPVHHRPARQAQTT